MSTRKIAEAKSRRKVSSAKVAHADKPSSQLVNEHEKYRFYFAKDISNNTLLHAAAFAGNQVICRELLNAGLSQTDMNDLALTPLHIAAIQGHGPCLGFLAISLRESTKCAHSDLAASVLQALLSVPESRTSIQDIKALITAVSHLSSGGGIDEHQYNGSDLAHAAVFANRGDVVQALVELQAKSCVPVSGFTSIVHACAIFNRNVILSILSSKGVNCSSVDAQQRTPFHAAVSQGSKEAAVSFVQMRQYPLRAKDDFGFTAVNYLTIALLKTASIGRESLKLNFSQHQAQINTVLAVVKICPELLLDALPCGISIFHLLATDSSPQVIEITQQLSAAVGEVVYAMPSNPFDARIIPLTVPKASCSDQSAAAAKNCSRMNNAPWIQPFLRPGDTPAMVAVRCCNSAALSIITQYASNPNTRCSLRSPLAQALQPRLQSQQKYCVELAQILLVHSSGGCTLCWFVQEFAFETVYSIGKT